VAKVDGMDSIKQSIFVILSTPVGSYFMMEDFGSNLQKLKFETNDRILESLIRFHVLDALAKWEKRARILDIRFQNVGEAQKNIIIYFAHKQRNEIDSFIYPFYRELIA
jgi:hypothetical protein